AEASHPRCPCTWSRSRIGAPDGIGGGEDGPRRGRWSTVCQRADRSPLDPPDFAAFPRRWGPAENERRDTMSQSGQVSGARSKSMGEREDGNERGHVLLLEDDARTAELLARGLGNGGV